MRKKIYTDNAPAPIGPYSQAVIGSGCFVFTAGQIPLDPASGQVVEGDIKNHTRQALKNLTAVLEASGATLHSVLKTTVYLKDMNEFITDAEKIEARFNEAVKAAKEQFAKRMGAKNKDVDEKKERKRSRSPKIDDKDIDDKKKKI